jgi:hypothetical protein
MDKDNNSGDPEDLDEEKSPAILVEVKHGATEDQPTVRVKLISGELRELLKGHTFFIKEINDHIDKVRDF